MILNYGKFFLEFPFFDVAEFAEDFGQGGVFYLLKGISDVAVKFDFSGTSSTFQKIQDLSLTFRQLDGTVIKLANFAEDININNPFLAVKTAAPVKKILLRIFIFRHLSTIPYNRELAL